MSDAFDAYGHDLLHGGFRQRSKKENLSARDKLQPSLLDRLTDDAPSRLSAPEPRIAADRTQCGRRSRPCASVARASPAFRGVSRRPKSPERPAADRDGV